MNIAGIDKGALLAELYNNAEVRGMGVFQAHRGPEVMSYDYGRELIAATLGGEFAHDNKMVFPGIDASPKRTLYFDYLFGRCLKVNLTGDECDEWGYDRDWGTGAFARCAEKARAAVSPVQAPPVVPTMAEKTAALAQSDIQILTGDAALAALGIPTDGEDVAVS